MQKCNKTRKLCENLECNTCLNKSFLSVEYSKNIFDININPRFISKFSNQKFDFKCNVCNHIHQTQINSISMGQGCPYCAFPSKLLCEDVNCIICLNRSFASHPKSIFWNLEENIISPRMVFKNSNSKFNFKCDCGHKFNMKPIQIEQQKQFCPYCAGKLLCDDENCQMCFNNSFATHNMSAKWSDKNVLLPRNIFKRTDYKALFDCDICNHEFTGLISVIKKNTLNCPYCAKKKLCENDNCKICFENSFASHPKSIYLSQKNNIIARFIFKNSGVKYIFDCNYCNNEFFKTPDSINGKNEWCPLCYYKTEKKIFEWLKKKYINIKHQFIIKKDNNVWKYDFLIKDLNIIIELDGPQHFIQISNWKCPEDTIINDINKINCSIENNYTIIHLLQNDVLNDLNDWEDKLIKNIKKYNTPSIVIINDVNNIYKKHLEKITNKNLFIY
jgi:hypothetical protein